MCFRTDMHFHGELGNSFLISLDFLRMNDAASVSFEHLVLILGILCGLIQVVVASIATFFYVCHIFCLSILFLAWYCLDLIIIK